MRRLDPAIHAGDTTVLARLDCWVEAGKDNSRRAT
jgi:hypothetical protein